MIENNVLFTRLLRVVLHEVATNTYRAYIQCGSAENITPKILLAAFYKISSKGYLATISR